jgi:hypothetical protein
VKTIKRTIGISGKNIAKRALGRNRCPFAEASGNTPTATTALKPNTDIQVADARFYRSQTLSNRKDDLDKEKGMAFCASIVADRAPA